MGSIQHHRDFRSASLLLAAAVATCFYRSSVGGVSSSLGVGVGAGLAVQAFQFQQPPKAFASRRNHDRDGGLSTRIFSSWKRGQPSRPTSSLAEDEEGGANPNPPRTIRPNNSDDDAHDADADDDEALLRTVTEEQLLVLCQQLQLDLGDGVVTSSSISTSSVSASSAPLTKLDLLRRLREHAHQQRLSEERRRRERHECVERGSRDDSSKERYETISGNDVNGKMGDEGGDDEDEDFFIALPWAEAATTAGAKGSGSTEIDTACLESASTPDRVDESVAPVTADGGRRRPGPAGYTTSAVVTAPPPPEQLNENGERAVTIYSSADHNDLTGIAAAQPGYGSASSAASSSSSTSTPQPWDSSAAASTAGGGGAASAQQVENAREMLSELVRCLLATTGAPAYSSGYDLDDDHDDNNDHHQIDDDGDLSFQVRQFFRGSRRDGRAEDAFVGFQPGSVPTQLLVAAGPSLRLRRGQVLQEVLRQFELEAIGYDGRAGDDRESGGGHYREVAKVSAFLEGYRTSEVRRLARETAALLLDRLVQEGVEGLDVALAAMARSSDDYRSDHAGELNDSLLQYLGDAIRQQEVKVLGDAKALKESRQRAALFTNNGNGDDNRLADAWTVEAEEDGRRVESIDPSDPNVRDALRNEYLREYGSSHEAKDEVSTKSPGEQLLFLLQLLKKRVEAEAAFAPDEKGRNLRLLAYCLRLGNDAEREQLILKEAGNSLDRIDSFMELVASSIEYGESTSHQLQPSKTKPLDVRRLRGIQDLCKQIRRRQPR